MPVNITATATLTPHSGPVNPYYVEASYTPLFTAPGGTPPTFSNIVATVTAIGRLCQLVIDADNTAGGTPGAGAVQLYVSLPFVANVFTTDGIFPIGSAVNGTDLEGLAGQSAGGTLLALWRLGLPGGAPRYVPLTAASLNDANVRHVDISMVYLI